MKEKRYRRRRPYTKSWEREANELARSWLSIVPCEKCGDPKVSGFLCSGIRPPCNKENY